MLKDNIIPRDFYLRIKNIKVPKTDMFSYEKDGLDFYKNYKYRTFIYCLSRKQDNTVLLNEKNKYCIELLLSMQCLSCDQIQKSSKIEPYSVVYENDAIEYIKEKIMDLYNNKSIMPVIESFIVDLLNDLKFVLKDEQYRDEEEVRFVLRIK